MAEASFRESLASFNSREQQESLLSSFQSSVQSSLESLQSNNEFFGLTRMQRILWFGIVMATSCLMFVISLFLLPMVYSVDSDCLGPNQVCLGLYCRLALVSLFFLYPERKEPFGCYFWKGTLALYINLSRLNAVYPLF
jgi:hypothetical protein